MMHRRLAVIVCLVGALAGCVSGGARGLEEPNETRARAWSEDGTIPHFLDPVFTLPSRSDIDWFELVPESDQRFFDVNVYSEAGRVALHIEDGDGTGFADLEGSGDGPEASGIGCDFRATPGEHYFLRITAVDEPSGRGWYSIHVYDPDTVQPFYEQRSYATQRCAGAAP
jgi:hypothetical protein